LQYVCKCLSTTASIDLTIRARWSVTYLWWAVGDEAGLGLAVVDYVMTSLLKEHY